MNVIEFRTIAAEARKDWGMVFQMIASAEDNVGGDMDKDESVAVAVYNTIVEKLSSPCDLTPEAIAWWAARGVEA